jgi:hypothetical protein
MEDKAGGSFRKKDKLVLAWRDKRTVMILITFHSGTKNEVTELPCRYPKKPPMKPNVELDYTKHMGGVDHSDHYIAHIPVYEDKEVAQKNVLVASGSEYSEFILTVCLGSGTLQ